MRILPKVNQVICTLDTIFDPNIMTLAKAVLQIFCSQLSLAYNEKKEKGDNSVMDLETLTKNKQVIYTLDTIYDPKYDPSLSGS